MTYRSFRNKSLLLIAGIAAVVLPISSQDGAAPAKKPSFEVASIKPGAAVLTRIMIQNIGNRFVAEGFSLKMLVARAYNVGETRVLEGPNWVDSERFNVEATIPAGAAGPGQTPLMLQSLLEDRFQLKVRRETRELPVYELVVARGGHKLKLSEDQTPPAPLAPPPGAGPAGPRGEPGAGPRGLPPEGLRGGARGGPTGPPPRGSFNRGNGQFQGTAVRITAVANTLSQQLGRPVIDKTGLEGLYDISLQYTPGAEQAPGPFALALGGPVPAAGAAPPPPDPTGPSLFTALQEQLGLRLESTKGPVEVVVIDSAQRPSEN